MSTVLCKCTKMKMRCYLWAGCCPSTAANAATSAPWAVWLLVVFRPTTAVLSPTDVPKACRESMMGTKSHEDGMTNPTSPANEGELWQRQS